MVVLYDVPDGKSVMLFRSVRSRLLAAAKGRDVGLDIVVVQVPHADLKDTNTRCCTCQWQPLRKGVRSEDLAQQLRSPSSTRTLGFTNEIRESSFGVQLMSS